MWGYMNLQDWPVTDRPREKLLTQGVSSLSETELLAIFLNTGTKKASVSTLARTVMAQFDDFRSLFSSSAEQLMKFPGIGKAKAATLLAIAEAARRSLVPKEIRKIRNSADIYQLLLWRVKDCPRERGYVVHVDTRNQLIKVEMLSEGGSQATIFETREIFRQAIRTGAQKIIVAHNHPSGDPTPSAEDAEVTTSLKKAGDLLGIPLLDHVVIGEGKYYSFADRKVNIVSC